MLHQNVLIVIDLLETYCNGKFSKTMYSNALKTICFSSVSPTEHRINVRNDVFVERFFFRLQIYVFLKFNDHRKKVIIR